VEIRPIGHGIESTPLSRKPLPAEDSPSHEIRDTALIEGRKKRNHIIQKPPAQASHTQESKTAAPPDIHPKKWTILVYAAADNDLKSDMVRSIDDLESVGSGEDMNLVVQFDHGGAKEKSPGIKRYYLEKGRKDGKISSPSLTRLGPGNMADPKMLTNFIKWGIKHYPSEHVLLLISDHGDGWKGAIDDESQKGWMSLPDITKAMKDAESKTGKKIDILGFDACLMASTEVAYELRDAADFMVASQDVEDVDGWPFSKLMAGKTLSNVAEKIKSRIPDDPKEFAKDLVRSVELSPKAIMTLSAVDLSKAKDLAEATDRLAACIQKTKVSPAVINELMDKSQGFFGESMKDVYDLADHIEKSQRIDDEKLKEAAARVKAAVKDAVIREDHTEDYPGAHGLQIESSTKEWHSQYGTNYKDTDFAKNTRWDEMLSQLDRKYLG